MDHMLVLTATQLFGIATATAKTTKCLIVIHPTASRRGLSQLLLHCFTQISPLTLWTSDSNPPWDREMAERLARISSLRLVNISYLVIRQAVLTCDSQGGCLIFFYWKREPRRMAGEGK